MSDTENHPGRKRVRPMTLTAFFNSIKKPKSDSISKQLEKGCIVRTIPKEPLKTQNQTRSAEDVHHKTDDAARDAVSAFMHDFSRTMVDVFRSFRSNRSRAGRR